MDWPMIALLALAAARATRLVTDDILPFGYLRDWLDSRRSSPMNKRTTFAHWLGHGFSCTFCVSVHAGFWAAFLATYAGWAPVEGWGDWPMFAALWWGLAGAVVLLEATVARILGEGE